MLSIGDYVFFIEMLHDIGVDDVLHDFPSSQGEAYWAIVSAFDRFLLPPLYNGVMVAHFQSSGILPCSNEAVKTRTSESAISSEHSFRIMVETPSGPLA